MSIKISNNVSKKIAKELEEDLTIICEDDYSSHIFYAFKNNLKYLYIPFNYAKNRGYPIRERGEFTATNFNYYKEEYPLREYQVPVKEDVVKILNKEKSCLLAVYPGFGKTAISLYIASLLKLKVLYINNNLTILDQIIASANKFTDAKVQLLSSGSTLEKDADIYVINAINVPKFPENTFKDIGFLVIDEVHCILSKVLSQSIYNIQPRYLLGLSATPYRNDGLDALFDLIFGKNNIVEKELYRDHTVYVYYTGIKPSIKIQASTRKLDWSNVIKSLSLNEKRNELIIKKIREYSKHTLLCLSKSVEQIKYLYSRLKELGENVDYLSGKKKKFDRDARVLIATTKKAGVGFDHDKINGMILCCDIEAYFLQSLGRCMRTPDVTPIIIDFIDNLKRLQDHFSTRESVYTKHGGTVHYIGTKISKESDIIPTSILRKNQYK